MVRYPGRSSSQVGCQAISQRDGLQAGGLSMTTVLQVEENACRTARRQQRRLAASAAVEAVGFGTFLYP